MKVSFIIKIAFFCLTVCSFSCRKSDMNGFKNRAVITGFDHRQCPCTDICPCVCGTILFHFADTTYTANIPVDNQEIFKLDANTKFPVYLRVNWLNTTRCGITAIKITDFKFN